MPATKSILDLPEAADGDDAVQSILPGTTSAPPLTFRRFDDVDATRKAIYESTFNAVATLPPISNKTHTLRLGDVHWKDKGDFSKAQRKQAILGGGSLERRMIGNWELLDNASNKVIGRRQVVIRVPHLTDAGTFVRNGTEYGIRQQQRMRAGVYARVKNNGEYESFFNVLANGPSQRYQLDPAKGIFNVNVNQANIPLLPLLKHLGASPDEIKAAWGDELYQRNVQKIGNADIDQRLAEKFIRGEAPTGLGFSQAIKDAFGKMTLDPMVTQHTLGRPFNKIDKEVILAATKKLLAVGQGKERPDDRDHLAFQQFVGPEDMLRERITKDRAGVRRQLLFRSSLKGHLDSMPSSAMQNYVDSLFTESGLSSPLEEVNMLEMLDKNTALTRMGEGGISSTDAIPAEARAVQPSHLGFIDSLRTPENFRAGVDTFLASNARKGSDGNIYAPFIDPKTGQSRMRNPQQLLDGVISWPAAMVSAHKRVPVMKNGRMMYALKTEVTDLMPPAEGTFSPLNNLVPFKSSLKGQRASMAARMISQALPLVGAETPLVQTGVAGSRGTRSYEQEYGKHAGAIFASRGGRVLSTEGNNIKVRYEDGREENLELHKDLTHNRKSGLTQTPLVEAGTYFKPGQVLAKSNYTDNQGQVALGLNARVAYMPTGTNYEDAIDISESMAKRLKSEHYYQHQLDVNDHIHRGRNSYLSLFPGKFDHATMAKFGETGTVKPGTVVQYGDPLILAAEEKTTGVNKIYKKGAPAFSDASLLWEHEDPGVVTDVVEGKDGPVVVVKTYRAAQVGDKLSGRHGNKGVIGAITPDSQMPHTREGVPFEVLLNPLGLASRVNPAQWAEVKLGAIAAKRGQPFREEDFDPNVPDRIAWVRNLAKQHGVPDTENVVDPMTGAEVPNIFTGIIHMLKLHHLAEDKLQGRGGGSYDSSGAPARGGYGGSKRVGGLDLSALLAAGGYANLADSHNVRGQKNDDYWLAFMQGHTPPKPGVPMVYQKFVNELKAAGINVIKNGTQSHLMAMTDKDVDRLAEGRNIESGDTVNRDDSLSPIKGGLFDPGMTGGHHGKRWAAVRFEEPMPSPVMEDPIRRVLGLSAKKFEAVLAGEEKLSSGKTGPAAIVQALREINVDRELDTARGNIESGRRGERDEAIRKLGYLKSAKRLGIHPKDWVLNRAPVLPTQFRPISVMTGSGTPLVADANYLYREMILANQNLRTMKQRVGEDGVGQERLALYKSFKAVTGLGDPLSQKSRDKNVKGLLQTIFGSRAKMSTVQRKLLGTTVDHVGRAVIAPDPDLDIDHVGLPESAAFDVYQRFIVRRLKRNGMPVAQALQEVKDHTPLARKIMLEEFAHRPVIVNRAPVLHKFGIMAHWPVLVPGHVMKVPPLTMAGMGSDADGDTQNFHVPVSEEARIEAIERLLPSHQLTSPADLKRAMYVPSHEFLAGLFNSTTAKSKHKYTFATLKDAEAAWAAGKLTAADQVTILRK